MYRYAVWVDRSKTIDLRRRIHLTSGYFRNIKFGEEEVEAETWKGEKLTWKKAGEVEFEGEKYLIIL